MLRTIKNMRKIFNSNLQYLHSLAQIGPSVPHTLWKEYRVTTHSLCSSCTNGNKGHTDTLFLPLLLTLCYVAHLSSILCQYSIHSILYTILVHYNYTKRNSVAGIHSKLATGSASYNIILFLLGSKCQSVSCTIIHPLSNHVILRLYRYRSRFIGISADISSIGIELFGGKRG